LTSYTFRLAIEKLQQIKIISAFYRSWISHSSWKLALKPDWTGLVYHRMRCTRPSEMMMVVMMRTSRVNTWSWVWKTKN